MGGGGVGGTPDASLAGRAREELRRRVVDRRYPPGTRLVEREVAAELRMSRVPVREALRSLAADGLLDTLPRGGTRVRSLGRADIVHLYEVWEPLAVQVSRLAARNVRRDPEECASGLAFLTRALDEAEAAAAAGDGGSEVAANTRFHDGVVALAGNPLLSRTMEQLGWQLQFVFGRLHDPAHMRAQHAVMYRHVAEGDETAAAAATLLHVRDSRGAALRSLFPAAAPTRPGA
ncbi:GntR family transcriptional regulator [Streptomyces sp. NPDC007088]|uniref:GntR family transcriptional regulator n=1 Tax=Streptomyces sp. NPDC007088 TaxID=3364773 RepID=UPI00369D15F5